MLLATAVHLGLSGAGDTSVQALFENNFGPGSVSVCYVCFIFYSRREDEGVRPVARQVMVSGGGEVEEVRSRSC